MNSGKSLYDQAKPYLVTAALAAAIIAPHIITTAFAQRTMILILMWAALGLAWNLIGGYAGQVSLGHAIFFGTGAYTTAIMNVRWEINPWLGMFGGMAVAIVLAVFLGSATFRLGGHYFAIATIAAGEIVAILVRNWEFAGGAVGLDLPIVRGDRLIDFQFDPRNKLPYYYIILGMLIVAILVTLYVERSRLGYYFRAIGEDPEAARSLGIDITRYKMIAMMLSAALTAMVGTFYAQFVLYVSTEGALALGLSIQVVLVAVLGGTRTVTGPIIGALVLIPMAEYTRVNLAAKDFFGLDLGGLHLVVFGFLIILVTLFQPGGLSGWIASVLRQLGWTSDPVTQEVAEAEA